MGGSSKSKAPAGKKTDEEKAAEKLQKAVEKAKVDLLKATKNGEAAKVEAALTLGVDINHTNERGQTAAHLAAAFGQRKILKLLHTRGADFSCETNDQHKFTPLTAARFVGEEETAKFIEALLDGTAVDIGDDSDDDDDDDEAPSGAMAGGQLVSTSGKGKRRQVGAAQQSDGALTSAPEEAETASAQVDTAPLIAERSDEIDKSESDHRSYRWLRLTNGMQVMLVSDPTCDYAAAAMDVGVGSSSDPVELPGLAHMLEHMLFLGTSKYPREDEYTTYLEQHGGESNAFTAHENTHYCERALVTQPASLATCHPHLCATAISAPPPSLPSLLPSLPSLTWADRLTPAADFDVQVRRLHSRHLSFRPPLMRTQASCSSLCTCSPPSPPLPLAACLPKRRARPFRPILHVPTLHRHRHRA